MHTWTHTCTCLNTAAQAANPVAEEVQNSTFSLKIMVSAGSVCVFHMGGHVDEVRGRGRAQGRGQEG